jgi:hypothetical protein
MRIVTAPVRPHENDAHIHALQAAISESRLRIVGESRSKNPPAPTLLPPVSGHDSLSPCRLAAIDSLSCGDTVRFSAVGCS